MFNLLKNVKTTKVMHHFSLINCVVLEKLTNQSTLNLVHFGSLRDK